MFFDTHVHFDDFVNDGTFDALLERAAQGGVRRMIAVGGSPEANALAHELAGRFPEQIFAAAGYDRHLAGSECDPDGLRALARSERTVAIGETGLDYFHGRKQAGEQQRLFEQCLQIAAEVCKPAIVHTREADADTAAILADHVRGWKGAADRVGVIHCFTRDRQTARTLLDLGFYISFSGIVTFLNADPLREVARFVPEDRLLIETDAPYLAPVPHRGRRCEPLFVADTAKRLAELRGCAVESLAEITTANAVSLFGLKKESA